MTSRKIPESAVENLVDDLASKADTSTFKTVTELPASPEDIFYFVLEQSDLTTNIEETT